MAFVEAKAQIGGFMKRNNKRVWIMLFIMSFILAFTACGKAPSDEQVKALIAKRLPFDWPGVQIESIGAIEFGEKIGEHGR